MIQSDFDAKIQKPDEKVDTGSEFTLHGMPCSHAGLLDEANPRLWTLYYLYKLHESHRLQ
jgi:hypothetical protein